MVICVKCVDGIAKNKAKDAGWKRIEGRWHCPKCLADLPPELIGESEQKQIKREMKIKYENTKY